MDSTKMILVPKMSKYEWDMIRYKLGHEGVMKKYAAEGISAYSIIASHHRQQEALDTLKPYFLNIVERYQLSKEVLAGADLVVVLGGDNHFQHVSHFIDSTPIMGINSDAARSEGALTYFVPEDFEIMLKDLEKGDYEMEEWPRLSADLNGTAVGMATSEYFLGEKERKFMSRHVLEIAGKSEEQKCSGLLVVTGAGSTGWYRSAGGEPFPKTEKTARFLATEVYRGSLSGYSLKEGVLHEDEELMVRSLNDSAGMLSADSSAENDFNRGATAAIRVSVRPLKVVARKKA